MTTPLNFYNTIVRESDLTQLISDKVRENLYLEFKTKHDSRHGNLEESDKRNFSKSLSGFANADGGVLIWGVKTNKSEEAAKLIPIKGVTNFLGVLKKSLLNSTQPPVENILIEAIPAAADADIGYIKCCIPQSDKTPHRAMIADREYYKRTVEGFYRLEHFDLEDMFGRRQRPLLIMEYEIKPKEGAADQFEIYFRFRNEGRNIARYYGFFSNFSQNMEIQSVHGLSNQTALNNGIPTLNFTNDRSAIHPNGVNIILGHAVFKRNDAERILMHARYYCQNMLPRELNAEF